MHQRDTRTRTHTPAIHAPASPARLPHRTRARLPLLMRRWASLVAHEWGARPCPPRLLRSGCRRFQHVPPCTNATHAHTATPSPSRASKPRTPATPRTRTLPHPRHPRTSEPRMPATPHMRTHTASNAALGVIHGAGWGARRLPAETLEIGLPPSPACAAMHQRDTRAHCHTSAIHVPASRARLPHPAGARIPPPSRASKPRAPAHPAASNAARASWWRRWSWRWE